MDEWSEQERNEQKQMIIDLIMGLSDSDLERIYEKVKQKYYAGDKALGSAVSQMCLERIARTRRKILDM